VISNVPGGIGVFEGVLLTALQFYMPTEGVASAWPSSPSRSGC